MTDICRNQSVHDETPQKTESDYFDAFSNEESCLETDSCDESDDESLTNLRSCSIKGSKSKVMPILIHNHMEKKEGHVHVQIQTPTRKCSGGHRKIPRTPVPGRIDPLTERLRLNLQSAFEDLEIEQRKRLGQKGPLQLGNSSLLKKRETRDMAI
ncbi:hypothetical protein ZYGR_0AS02030 [Zygosaccharomyces rouxii]|uniref:Uncharacterized protein n=1 Tax=Zygosaccharomyces rouxii TaxID=4956 RepID=A0A1Q3AGT8_ZYGRO|nr:hypothetical protein ZYGR_0AS02030 [Zygosaccharomyces rouxii]